MGIEITVAETIIDTGVTLGTTVVTLDYPGPQGAAGSDTGIIALDRVLNQPSNTIETLPRAACSSTNVTNSNGQLKACFFTPLETLTVTTFTIYCTSTGVDTDGTSYRRIALYTVDGTTITLVARTANTPTMFSATGARSFSFDTTGGYPSSYTLNAGTRYAVGIYSRNDNGTHRPGLYTGQVNSSSSVMAADPRISGSVTITSGDLPTTAQTVSDVTSTPYVRLTP